MCGIAGFLNHTSLDQDTAVTLRAMTTAIAHRGPDDSGIWVDTKSGVALGHRRLSIIDTSSAGHQPMTSRSGRYVLVFNGEIYNHLDLRRRIGASSEWRGTSDTETLLEAISVWGFEKALDSIVGMFAFALWDRLERTLILARDRMGEKPLYYGWWKDNFLFASELKAFHQFPGFAPSLDPNSLSLYLQQGAVPAPFSIYKDIWKLEPGHVAIIRWNERWDSSVLSEAYWKLESILEKPMFKGSESDAANELERLLTRSITSQMVADVPIGALLSGGIDSSCIVALMQKSASTSVKTYSIGFTNEQFNEANYAGEIAKYLETSHTEFFVTEEESLNVIPKLSEIWDEPFGDSSQIPTYIVSQLARKDVTVALSGDGGDELFAGYARHSTINDLEKVLGGKLGSALSSLIPMAASIGSNLGFPRATANRLQILSEIIEGRGVGERYLRYNFQPNRNRKLLRKKDDLHLYNNTLLGRDVLETVSAIDATTYLPNTVLTKVDRASMAASLETRVPLLDHRIVEFAFSLPSSYKTHQGQTKWPLRKILNKHVPTSLTNRPKMGFGVPIAEWLRGKLKDWAEDLLGNANNSEHFDMNYIRQIWAAHQKGGDEWTTTLWRFLMFVEWQKRYG